MSCHVGDDEPSGTWTRLACPDQGVAAGSDVNLEALNRMRGVVDPQQRHKSIGTVRQQENA
jgi:hypothetical protein